MQTLVQVVLPEMGESVAEGSVTSWRKKPGDFVAAGEALVDVTTDKVDVEVPSPAAGKLVRIFAEEGKTVAVGAPLAEIDTTASDGKRGAGETPASQSPASPSTEKGAIFQSPPATSNNRNDLRASPSARKAAAKHGITLDRITPAIPGETIRRSDVDRVVQGNTSAPSGALSQTPAASPPVAAEGKAVRLRGAAAALADHMERSLGIPTATSFRTIAVRTLDARRRELNTALRAAGRSEKISFTHLIAFAIVRATATVPLMASSFRRTAEGPERVERGVHLGLAVDVKRGDGSRMLVVPVVRNADTLDFLNFLRAYEALVEKARGGSLGPAELSGSNPHADQSRRYRYGCIRAQAHVGSRRDHRRRSN